MTNTSAPIWTPVRKLFSFLVIFFISVTLFVTAPDVAIAQEFNPFAASDLLFYEGNNCTQDIVFTYNSEKASDDNCQTSETACYGHNDEARSLLITGFAKPGTRVKVYDSPSADTTDDYTIIDILPDLLPLGACVSTVEQSLMRPGYRMGSVRKDGLDGKVSHVTVQP